MPEAVIKIDGTELSQGESMTVRCALSHFVDYLQNYGLGDDIQGRATTRGYIANAQTLLGKISKSMHPHR